MSRFVPKKYLIVKLAKILVLNEISAHVVRQSVFSIEILFNYTMDTVIELQLSFSIHLIVIFVLDKRVIVGILISNLWGKKLIWGLL